jgi:SAM-dependent methyltransferase
MQLLDRYVFPHINDFVLGKSVVDLRRRVAGAAEGHVLEIGAGTGLNFDSYRDGVSVVAIEPAEGMRLRAGARARGAGVRAQITVVDGNAQALPFDAAAFDAVVATFVLCSVRALDGALAEAHRVLRPGGRLHLVEHVKNPDPRIARWQDRGRPVWQTLLGGCDPTRDIAAALDHAGFDTGGLQRLDLPLPWLAKAGIIGSFERP